MHERVLQSFTRLICFKNTHSFIQERNVTALCCLETWKGCFCLGFF